jgi:hypothetical protein
LNIHGAPLSPRTIHHGHVDREEQEDAQDGHANDERGSYLVARGALVQPKRAACASERMGNGGMG